MSGSGALSGVYSVSDVKSIVAYAANRGVRVIPELDTPAHSLSWGQSPSQKDMVVQCASGGYGQFDPTVDLTYQVMDDVLLQANATFLDNYIHFGGDEVDLNCWERKPSIKQFMIKNNIPSYYELEIYFRQKQKKLWRSFSNKKVIYWANEDIDLPL